MREKILYHPNGIRKIISKVNSFSKKKLILNFFKKDIYSLQKRLLKLRNKSRLHLVANKGIEKSFFYIINSFIKRLSTIENKIKERSAISMIKKEFRNYIQDLHDKSILFEMSYLKPSGYPGDYKIMEIFYDNMPVSKGFSYYWEKYILGDHYVVAVRNRKDLMKKVLRNYIAPRQRDIKILNLGCGSCREIRELFGERFNPQVNILMTLIDQDKKALEFSKSQLSNFSFLKLKCMEENVINLFRAKKDLKNRLKGQDLIYSIGLADYLPDIILSGVIKFCFEVLKPGGSIFLAHKNTTQYKFLASDWFCDWYFIPRSKKELTNIVKSCLANKKYLLKIADESTRRVFFISITRLK